jgi:hypothetical protein
MQIEWRFNTKLPWNGGFTVDQPMIWAGSEHERLTYPSAGGHFNYAGIMREAKQNHSMESKQCLKTGIQYYLIS